MSQYKTIYKDKDTGKLLHKAEAENRDPASYTIEQFNRGAAIASIQNTAPDDVAELHEETTDVKTEQSDETA